MGINSQCLCLLQTNFLFSNFLEPVCADVRNNPEISFSQRFRLFRANWRNYFSIIFLIILHYLNLYIMQYFVLSCLISYYNFFVYVTRKTNYYYHNVCRVLFSVSNSSKMRLLIGRYLGLGNSCLDGLFVSCFEIHDLNHFSIATSCHDFESLEISRQPRKPQSGYFLTKCVCVNLLKPLH